MPAHTESRGDEPPKPKLCLLRGAPDLALDDIVAFCELVAGRLPTEAGDWIEEGASFGRVVDVDGGVLEELRAPASGTVLYVMAARWIKDKGFAGKIGVP